MPDEAIIMAINRAAPRDAVPVDVALDELYRREYAGMVRLAHLITGSNEAAEDVVQDSFMRLQRSGSGRSSPARTCAAWSSTGTGAGSAARSWSVGTNGGPLR